MVPGAREVDVEVEVEVVKGVLTDVAMLTVSVLVTATSAYRLFRRGVVQSMNGQYQRVMEPTNPGALSNVRGDEMFYSDDRVDRLYALGLHTAVEVRFDGFDLDPARLSRPEAVILESRQCIEDDYELYGALTDAGKNTSYHSALHLVLAETPPPDANGIRIDPHRFLRHPFYLNAQPEAPFPNTLSRGPADPPARARFRLGPNHDFPALGVPRGRRAPLRGTDAVAMFTALNRSGSWTPLCFAAWRRRACATRGTRARAWNK